MRQRLATYGSNETRAVSGSAGVALPPVAGWLPGWLAAGWLAGVLACWRGWWMAQQLQYLQLVARDGSRAYTRS